MTTQEMILKARANAVIKAEEQYKEICEGICDWKAEIEADKLTGEYYDMVDGFAYHNIMDCIKVVKRTNLLTAEQKQVVISELHETEEYRRTEKKVAKLFAEHFVRCKDAYI